MTLVERLREIASVRTSALFSQRKTLNEAADEIERLEKALEKALETALEKLWEIHGEEHNKLGAMLLDKRKTPIETNWQGGKVNGIVTAIEAIRTLSQKKEG